MRLLGQLLVILLVGSLGYLLFHPELWLAAKNRLWGPPPAEKTPEETFFNIEPAHRTPPRFAMAIETGERRLLYSLADVAAHIPEPPDHTMEGATFYFWHCKYNPQGTRIMQVLRCLFPDGWGARNAMAFTVSADGQEIHHTPSDPVWQHTGGHPNWHPDGDHLLRNLYPGGGPVRFCKVRYDGSGGIQAGQLQSGRQLVKLDEQPARTGADVEEAPFRAAARDVPGENLVGALEDRGSGERVVEDAAQHRNAFRMHELQEPACGREAGHAGTPSPGDGRSILTQRCAVR